MSVLHNPTSSEVVISVNHVGCISCRLCSLSLSLSLSLYIYIYIYIYIYSLWILQKGEHAMWGVLHLFSFTYLRRLSIPLRGGKGRTSKGKRLCCWSEWQQKDLNGRHQWGSLALSQALGQEHTCNYLSEANPGLVLSWQSGLSSVP